MTKEIINEQYIFEKMKKGIRERLKRNNGANIEKQKGPHTPDMYDIDGYWLAKVKKKYPELADKAKQEVMAENDVKKRAKTSRSMKRHFKKKAKQMARAKMEKIAAEVDLSDEEVARRELAQRELARRNLIASILRFNDDYLAGWVHKDICARLERFMRQVEAGENPRLMLQMPPRHGKSKIASQEFPAWMLGHHPEWELIVCSYAESLALDFSRAVRERIRDKQYRALFPDTKLDRENQNAQGWKTTKKGGFLPAGVEGPITGKGAHVLIIDDPVKNSQEAESELKRTNIMNWYGSTAYTRLAPGGGVLVIQTRWHLDDLSGRLEQDMMDKKGDEFEVVRYPAIAVEDERYRKKNDPLHEERYSVAQLKMIRKAVGERTWAALYQQNPVPDEGAHFQRSMIKYYFKEQLPELLTTVTAWDLAIGQKEINDKTVGFTWGKDLAGDYWFLDCRHGHFDAFDIVNEICDGYVKHKPFTVAIEKDKVALAVGPLLDTVIDDRGLYALHITELRPAQEGNKVTRARALQGMMRQGRVWLPHPDECDWVHEFVTELLQFPYGRHDDHVDAAAWLALLSAETPAPGNRYSVVPQRESWRDRLRHMSRSARTMMSS